jgi:hypothetical protein
MRKQDDSVHHITVREQAPADCLAAAGTAAWGGRAGRR